MTTDEVKQRSYKQKERRLEFDRIQVEKNLQVTKKKKNYYTIMISFGVVLVAIPIIESRMFAAGIFMYMVISKIILITVNNMEWKRKQLCMYIFPIAAIMFVCTLLISGELTTLSFETSGTLSDIYRVGGVFLLWKSCFWIGMMLSHLIEHLKDKKIKKIIMR